MTRGSSPDVTQVASESPFAVGDVVVVLTDPLNEEYLNDGWRKGEMGIVLWADEKDNPVHVSITPLRPEEHKLSPIQGWRFRLQSLCHVRDADLSDEQSRQLAAWRLGQ